MTSARPSARPAATGHQSCPVCGRPGSSGALGPSGSSGASGVSGSFGLSGVSGVSGTSGLSGVCGGFGLSGLSGSPESRQVFVTVKNLLSCEILTRYPSGNSSLIQGSYAPPGGVSMCETTRFPHSVPQCRSASRSDTARPQFLRDAETSARHRPKPSEP